MPQFGNYIRTAHIVGPTWALDVKLIAKDTEGYEKAKQAMADLYNSADVNIWVEPDDN